MLEKLWLVASDLERHGMDDRRARDHRKAERGSIDKAYNKRKRVALDGILQNLLYKLKRGEQNTPLSRHRTAKIEALSVTEVTGRWAGVLAMHIRTNRFRQV